jgi:hypothetical protein
MHAASRVMYHWGGENVADCADSYWKLLDGISKLENGTFITNWMKENYITITD